VAARRSGKEDAEMKQVWAAALKAQRTDGTWSFVAVTFMAESKREAVGIAHEWAEKQYPRLDGWFDHSVSVCLVTEDQHRLAGYVKKEA
jgi:hypothetical protein